MYSLYRAWFGGEEAYPRLETLSPPDTLVRVGNDGEHQFVAHRGVLAAHSGYLKALLATATNSTTTSGREDASLPVTSVTVSSVGSEAFAPLLNYMYTGRLDVTLDNIYSVLLATHLLHMPGALEQCRAALLRLRGPPPPMPAPPASRAGTILRPVPNRLVGPTFNWSQPTNLYPTTNVGISHLTNLQIPGSLSMIPNSIVQEQTPPTIPYSFRESTPSPPHSTLELRRNRQDGQSITEIPIDSGRTKDKLEKPRETVETDKKKDDDGISIVESVPSPICGNDRTSFQSMNEQTTNRRGNASSRSSNDPPSGSASTSNSGVVYDVACCDGPVRFHRVLNENYVSTKTTTTTTTTSTTVNPQRSRIFPSDDDNDVGDVVENDENGKPEVDNSNDNENPAPSGSGTITGSYTCTYCRHTFKSHYCYRKHARRHLLPATEVDGNDNSTINVQRADSRRREVRLLDLNVQYYPCKICGSKFPSYYFVHKHRKLCHPNVDDRGNVADVESTSVGGRNTNNTDGSVN